LLLQVLQVLVAVAFVGWALALSAAAIAELSLP
jgi:hypothetical protein